MKKYNLESAKFLIIISAMCLIFIWVIWQAFSYLPKNESEKVYLDDDVTTISFNSIADKDITEQKMEELEETDKIEKAEDVSLKEVTEKKEYKYELITDNDLKENINIDESKNFIRDAKIAKAELKLDEAIQAYENAVLATKNNETKAECYEQLAILYAKKEKYELALNLAQKSYNLDQNLEREVLIAKLYYKTGDTNRGLVRMNNILKREF